MKKTLLFTLIILILLLAACSAGETTAIVEPTVAPTEAPAPIKHTGSVFIPHQQAGNG